MISKNYRFRNFDFDKFFKLSKKSENDVFKVWVAESNNSIPRFSVIPSKKIVKTSVKRNRIRRIIYEILRLNIDKIKKADFVITPKKDIEELDFKTTTKKILELL